MLHLGWGWGREEKECARTLRFQAQVTGRMVVSHTVIRKSGGEGAGKDDVGMM